ncbi:glycosyltransferase family 2 protein [uncultured Algibacter sp.]|uniref:glycosyltransferase family 2 protein n=1 Tax=uncultured Algibacter sp. TaxID=298659 RepID=UPI00261884FE|nr:glycosyltransferase family 2 protein [uncultured Algibacter sp.]
MSRSTFIVIVTYNGIQWLEKCLKSCSDYPVIVIDNASTDGTCSFIETNFPEVILFRQKENKGFGQANNIGIHYALEQGAEHVFLLNQDAYLVDNVLDELVTFQKKHKKYGIISPIHVTNDRNKMDENFAKYMLREVTGQFYSDFVLGNPIQEIYDVPFINAASWLISKKCLETIGGFDPLFFHYGEDNNYCQRVLYHNFKIGVLPKTYVIHDRTERKKKPLIEFTEHYFSNRLLVFKKKQANILQDERMDKYFLKLRKLILKLQIQGKFKRATGYKKELAYFKEVYSEILESRKVNKTKGKHYLS